MPVSATSLKALRERRAALCAQFRAIVDKAEAENRALAATENAELERLHTADVELRNRIQQGERALAWVGNMEALAGDVADELNREGASHVSASEFAGALGDAADRQGRGIFARQHGRPANDFARAFRAWGMMRHGIGNPSDDDLKMMKAVGFSAHKKSITIPLVSDIRSLRQMFRNAMTSGSSPGTHLSDLDFLGPIEFSMLWFGPMLRVCDIIRTSHGNTITWPTFDDTANTGAYINEATADTLQDPTTSNASFGAHKITSRFIKVATELHEDSEFNIAEVVGNALGERIGRKLNTEMTTGTSGAAKILGWQANAATGKTAAAVAAITADELLDLKFSVDAAYRELPGAGFQTRDATILAMKKLKDTAGQYLWQPSLQAGTPDRFDGDVVLANNDVPAMATGVKSVGYGAWSKYKLRQVREIRVVALSERWGDEDVIGYGAYIRADGKILDAGTDPIKVLAQA